MKQIYTTIAACFLICTGLVSCEMKEELFDNKEIPTETGRVTLGVTVNDNTNIITKADATPGGDEQGSSVDPDDYPVTFALKETDFTKDYVYSEIKGKEIELPIGTYTVASHTPGELTKKMDHAYYGGDNQLVITKNVTAKATVVCKMLNSRILVTFDDSFTSKFSDWTITIDDGSGQILTYTKTENGTNLQPVYWLMEEHCSAIKMNVTAKTTSGQTVRESRTITKPDGAANSDWTGGDALTITMEPGPDNPEEPTGVSGIKITIKAFFETKKDEVVEVPIEGDDNTPTDPDAGDGEDEDGETTEGPTLSGEYLNQTISYDKKDGDMAFPNVAVDMSAPAGIKNVYIKATCTDIEVLEPILRSLGFMNEPDGVDLVTEGEAYELSDIFTLPKAGDPSYPFTLGTLGTMLTVGEHTFNVKLVDQNDKEATGFIKFVITDSSATN